MNSYDRFLKWILLTVTLLSGLILIFSSVHFAQKGTWIERTDMPTARWGHASCIVDGKIYVIGGSDATNDRGDALGVMEVYNAKTGSWDTSKEPMPNERIGLMAAAIDGVIYAIGGRKIWVNADISTVEAYDTRTDTWSSKSSMPRARSVAGCCVYDGKIYIMGGQKNYTTWMTSDDLQIYDPATDTWDDTKAKMNKLRGGLRACTASDKIYAVGGYDTFPWFGLETIEAYAEVNNQWIVKSKLNEGRYNASVNSVNGLLYIIGGAHGTDPVESVEVYDPVSDKCEIIDQTPMWFTLNSSSVYDSEIYLFGGSTTGQGTYLFRPSNKVYSYKLIPVSVEFQNDKIPCEFTLDQNYPNPFNPNTTIKYSLPFNNSDLSLYSVQLRVYDILGKEVTTLVNEKQKPGNYEMTWNSSAEGQKLGSGTYFYQIIASVSSGSSTNKYVETRKMVLIK